MPAKFGRATLAPMRRLVLLLTLFAAGAHTSAALGAGVTAVELDASAAVGAKRFDLVGVHWRGSGRVAFRTRSVDGTWSGWRPAAPEDGDGPTPGSREARPATGWRIGNPWWVGPSDRIETRASGDVSRIRAYLVRSPESLVPLPRSHGGGRPRDRPASGLGRG